jgi:hypothetical protein
MSWKRTGQYERGEVQEKPGSRRVGTVIVSQRVPGCLSVSRNHSPALVELP